LKKHTASQLAAIQEEEESTPRPSFIPTERFDGEMGWASLSRSSFVHESSSYSNSLLPSTIPFIPSTTADQEVVDGEVDDAASMESSDEASVFDQSSDSSSYTASLLSDVQIYRYENNRRYHSYREGHYVLPNDEQEQDRQDLLHHVRNLVLNDQLFRTPLGESPQRVLDVGTGTGIWAIDFADSFPSAEVTGTDLSPIQPSWVPPNLRFIVDDAESPWLYSVKRPFDFIHARDLAGAITDWPRLIRQSYEHLRPGGWIELQEFEVTLRADDDSMRLAPTLCDFIEHLQAASVAFDRPMNIAEGHRQRLIEAGFEDVRDDVYKVQLFSSSCA
jgi:trans-aconitate methyltransferase